MFVIIIVTRNVNSHSHKTKAHSHNAYQYNNTNNTLYSLHSYTAHSHSHSQNTYRYINTIYNLYLFHCVDELHLYQLHEHKATITPLVTKILKRSQSLINNIRTKELKLRPSLLLIQNVK
ncbi:hypothetical protein JYU34_010120 [Plutella xylostella]|uniref:Uncharacterized protein n=1 Tax=Plutella xylostella TaxID=51655 RepID=A0ABQ7QHU7_PLUXY|nr:hypothetical protein JYU34_010120 [Plutella xylostella]